MQIAEQKMVLHTVVYTGNELTYGVSNPWLKVRTRWLFLCTRHYTTSFHSTWLKIVSCWPMSAADHCERSADVLTCATKRTRTRLGDRSFSVAETSHLNSLRDFWRHFSLCRAAAHSDWCFFAPCINILPYLLTYTLRAFVRIVWTSLVNWAHSMGP